MTSKVNALARDQFKQWIDISSRWGDNDQYGHINNVLYYSFFDTAVNQLLMQHQLLDPHRGNIIGLVVQSHCDFLEGLSFPGLIQAGVRVAHLGRTSVKYEIGLFSAGKIQSAAHGHFVHVYVDRHTRRPIELPPSWRVLLEQWTPSTSC